MYGRPEDIFRESAQDECSRVAHMIVAEIQRSPKTPVDKGNYKEGFDVHDDYEGASVINRAIDRPENLWNWLEFGHDQVTYYSGVKQVYGHVGPYPHIRPAISAVEQELKK